METEEEERAFLARVLLLLKVVGGKPPRPPETAPLLLQLPTPAKNHKTAHAVTVSRARSGTSVLAAASVFRADKANTATTRVLTVRSMLL